GRRRHARVSRDWSSDVCASDLCGRWRRQQEAQMPGEARVEMTRFILNGAVVAVSAPPDERLSDSLRERLGARDVKIGCNAGDCGARKGGADGSAVGPARTRTP